MWPAVTPEDVWGRIIFYDYKTRSGSLAVLSPTLSAVLYCKYMRVVDVMKTTIYTVSPDATLQDAVKLLLKHQTSGLVVVESSRVVGILSEKDIYRVFYPSYQEYYAAPESFTDFQQQEHEIASRSQLFVREVMTTNVLTVGPNEFVMKVGSIMLARNIHRLPVIDAEGQLVGVVTRGCIYRALFRQELKL